MRWRPAAERVGYVHDVSCPYSTDSFGTGFPADLSDDECGLTRLKTGIDDGGRLPAVAQLAGSIWLQGCRCGIIQRRTCNGPLLRKNRQRRVNMVNCTNSGQSSPNLSLVRMPLLSSNRASFRRSVRAFRQSSNLRAVLLCSFDVSLFFGSLAGVILIDSLAFKIIAAIIAGLAIARLFVVGHDACHQAFFSNRKANRWIGSIVFLPSLTPFSLWEAGHNVSHHVYTNLKTHDFVWTPLSLAEYQAMPSWRRQLERFYRSGFGFWAYYGIEIWWRKMMFPNKEAVPLQRPAFFRDSLQVSVFAVIWIAFLVALASATAQSPALLVVLGFIVPQIVWQLLMGAVIYFQHTNPGIAWFDNTAEWETTREGLSGTMLITFPNHLGRLINNIMEHPAHHLDVRIPLYEIEAAQSTLNTQATGAPSQAFSWKFITDCVHRCKLYDYAEHRWTDFEGNFTSERVFEPVAEEPGMTATS